MHVRVGSHFFHVAQEAVTSTESWVRMLDTKRINGDGILAFVFFP